MDSKSHSNPPQPGNLKVKVGTEHLPRPYASPASAHGLPSSLFANQLFGGPPKSPGKLSAGGQSSPGGSEEGLLGAPNSALPASAIGSDGKPLLGLPFSPSHPGHSPLSPFTPESPDLEAAWKGLAEQPIPKFELLEEFYTEKTLKAQRPRWRTLPERFDKAFGGEGLRPQWVTRAPGRVNIMGEHVDYNGFSVIPAAIERDILIAGLSVPHPDTGATKHKIVLINNDSQFKETVIEYDVKDKKAETVQIDLKNHDWGNYFKAALKGVLRYVYEEDDTRIEKTPKLVRLYFDGNVPLGAGLSSSAAMVTSSGLAVLQALAKGGPDTLCKKDYADTVIECERLVGVNSGGMDQAASIFSQPDHLLHIEFYPTLAATPVLLPKHEPLMSFVIANTMKRENKAETAAEHYNLRVIECQVAALILAKQLEIKTSPTELPTLKTILASFFAAGSMSVPAHPLPVVEAVSQLKAVTGKINDAMKPYSEGLTWDQVWKEIDMEEEEFKKKCMPFEVKADKLMVTQRVAHVFSEASRVYGLRTVLELSASTERIARNGWQNVGSILSQSQRSCRDQYDCSCPEIEEINEVAKECGASGSRLTGAGWGGCTVHVVLRKKEDEFVQALKDKYYSKKYPNMTPEEMNDAIFATEPEAGACIYTVPPK